MERLYVTKPFQAFQCQPNIQFYNRHPLLFLVLSKFKINFISIAGYFEDDASDELTNDPVFKSVLEKDALASQPTVSRFFNRMDEDTLNQFLAIARVLRRKIYSIQMPQAVILDLDSTLLDAYGRQEGRAFNFHYQSNGYHPLVCYDGMTGDLIKIQLRDGTKYSCTGVVDFFAAGTG